MIYEKLIVYVNELCKNFVSGHGMDHFMNVTMHAIKALEYEPSLSDHTKELICIAAFLHDIDDKKLFPHSKNNENARSLLQKIRQDIDEKDIEDIIKMINYVSCSENGPTYNDVEYMAIPRDCDRLEAIGEIGIKRCREYGMHINLPRHTKHTKRAKSIDDLYLIANDKRYEDYTKGKKSESEIDHYYDKLLHIERNLVTTNEYIRTEAKNRQKQMIDYVLDYSWTGSEHLHSTDRCSHAET